MGVEFNPKKGLAGCWAYDFFPVVAVRSTRDRRRAFLIAQGNNHLPFEEFCCGNRGVEKVNHCCFHSTMYNY